MTMPEADADVLLSHAGFVRALARGLLLDPDRTDDVVQETLMAALERPPADRSKTRAWLGAVGRRKALRLLRAEARLRKRERRAARGEALPSTAEVVSQLEIQREVVAAVLALEEPYRSTVVYRFFHDIPPREIAKRQDVELRTVESRITRALKQLRGRLDGKYGNRRAWAIALLPLAIPKVAAAAAIPAAAVAAVLVVAVGAGAWGVVNAVRTPEPVPRAATTMVAQSPAPPLVEDEVAPPHVDVERFEQRVEQQPAPTPREPPGPGTIEGEVKGARGAEVRVRLEGYLTRPNGTTPLSGPPLDVKRETRRDAQGRYRFDGLSPGNYRLSAFAPGFSPSRSGYWLALAKGKGMRWDLELSGGGTLRVRVLGPSGEPVEGREVTLEGDRERGALTARTDEGGTCLFEHLENGTYTAMTRDGSAVYRRPAHVRELMWTRLDFRLGSRLTGIVLGPDEKPLSGARLRLRPGGADGWLVAVTDKKGRFEILGGPPSTYWVHVRLPRPGGFDVPAGRVRVEEAGATDHLIRIGPSVIGGRVTFKETGEPLTDRIQILASPGWAEAIPDEEGRYRFPGLEAGSYQIRVYSSDGSLRDEERAVVLGENGRVEGVDFVIDRHRWGHLKLEAVDKDGKPITDLAFQHAGPVNRDVWLNPWRGEDGTYTFRLDAGEYHLQLTRDGRPPMELKFEIEEGRTVHRSVQWEEER